MTCFTGFTHKDFIRRLKKITIFAGTIYIITFHLKLNMKKFVLVAVVATFGLASCKKDYVCTYKDGSGATQTQNYPGLTKTGKTSAETSCTVLGGTLSKK